jgi:hypothetical protein
MRQAAEPFVMTLREAGGSMDEAAPGGGVAQAIKEAAPVPQAAPSPRRKRRRTPRPLPPSRPGCDASRSGPSRPGRSARRVRGRSPHWQHGP